MRERQIRAKVAREGHGKWFHRLFGSIGSVFPGQVGIDVNKALNLPHKKRAAMSGGISKIGKLYQNLKAISSKELNAVGSNAELERVKGDLSDAEAARIASTNGTERSAKLMQEFFNDLREQYNALRRRMRASDTNFFEKQLLTELRKHTDRGDLAEKLGRELFDLVNIALTKESAVRDSRGRDTGKRTEYNWDEKEAINDIRNVVDAIVKLNNNPDNVDTVKGLIQDIVNVAQRIGSTQIARRQFYFPHVFTGSHSVWVYKQMSGGGF